jgi:hypothetical protein
MLPEMSYLKQNKKFELTHREVYLTLNDDSVMYESIRHINEIGAFVELIESNIIFYPWTSIKSISYKI